MIIGVPKEIKIHEYRIGMTPASVRELTARGHTVLVETDAVSLIRSILLQVLKLQALQPIFLKLQI